MSGIDRANAVKELISVGWVEIEGREGRGSDYLVPPDSLWRDRPKSFYVYDGAALQELLSPRKNDDDDDDVE